MFNNLLHQAIRSQIMSLLIKDGELSFKVLKKSLDLSDGNLSSHIAKLEKVDYVEVRKGLIGKRVVTTVVITDEGREEFKVYIAQLQEFIRSSK